MSVATEPFASVGTMVMLPLRYDEHHISKIAAPVGALLLAFNACEREHGGIVRVYPEVSKDGRFHNLMIYWELAADMAAAKAWLDAELLKQFATSTPTVSILEPNVAFDEPIYIGDQGFSSEAVIRGLPYVRALDKLVAEIDRVTAGWQQEQEALWRYGRG